VNSARGFYEQLLAFSPDPATGKPDPAQIKTFLAAHPKAARALTLIKQRQVTSGFVDSTFNSLNAFRFVDAAGASVPVRWSVVPAQPVAADATEQPEAGDENYLFDALIAQIAQHPPQWRLIVAIGQAGDPTNDATQPWPEDRQQIDAGTVTIDRASSEDGGRCTVVNYDPLVLPAGIEPSDDPLLSARSAVYARSFTLRAEEEHEKPPSAVTPQDVQAGGKS
jgi:catalase